jgi:heavy metal sensor kinase
MSTDSEGGEVTVTLGDGEDGPPALPLPNPKIEKFLFFREGGLPGKDLPPRLLDLQGKPLSPSLQGGPWDLRTFKDSANGDSLYSTILRKNATFRVYSAPIFHRGKQVGVVQVAHPLDEMRSMMAGLDRTLLMLIPLALLLSGIGGAFLTDRALRPFRDLSEAAERVSAQDLSRRLPTDGGDEFAKLASHFNRMFDRLENAFGNLEEAYQRQRRFTADASHELRTPLTTIKANASLALTGQRAPEQYRHALSAVDRAADEMNRIVQDLLTLARSDSGQLVLEKEPLPVLEILQRADSSVLRADSAPSVEIAAPPALTTYGDSHCLIRLFVNLLENAARHTPPDGRISLRAQESEGEIEVLVQDTGEGISPEHLARLGERFYRVDAARSRALGGIGLGLAICRSIVREHGGSLSIASELGKGATVTVRLPLYRESEEGSAGFEAPMTEEESEAPAEERLTTPR